MYNRRMDLVHALEIAVEIQTNTGGIWQEIPKGRFETHMVCLYACLSAIVRERVIVYLGVQVPLFNLCVLNHYA